jgi:hypothetical protein
MPAKEAARRFRLSSFLSAEGEETRAEVKRPSGNREYRPAGRSRKSESGVRSQNVYPGRKRLGGSKQLFGIPKKRIHENLIAAAGNCLNRGGSLDGKTSLFRTVQEKGPLCCQVLD